MKLRELFPPIEPYNHGQLRVDKIHTLYWEECGNPDGVPVVFVHGGPGGGSSPTHRRFFDPSSWRIILFDQRGSGRSKPFQETLNNTTNFLISDLEKLRKHLKIERWHIFGGSWGSTLALAYAEKHPDYCLGLMLRGVFLFRKKEMDWFFRGIGNVFPEAWTKFAEFIHPDERHDLLKAYHRIFSGKDEVHKKEAIRTWLTYEISCSTMYPGDGPDFTFLNIRERAAIPVFEAHYMINGGFLKENQLLDNIDRVRHIPGVIVQGRYDMICPIVTANELHKSWPEAEYVIVPDAGHTSLEPGICSALIETTEKFKNIK
ncbi:MAG: prolyl aminopeptidase [Alphaproteobacteria bacterium]|nr:prolyl aminopeptidase [Alphaproteobacteria bacterium]